MVLTYRYLEDKYPALRDEIEELKHDKNLGLNYNRIFFFGLGMFVCYILSVVI
jgi:hypothetical protein